jgi:hypothetical protein
MKKLLLLLLPALLATGCTRVYLQGPDGTWTEQRSRPAPNSGASSELVIRIEGDRLSVQHDGAAPARTEVYRESSTAQRFYVHEGWVVVQTVPALDGQTAVRVLPRRKNAEANPEDLPLVPTVEQQAPIPRHLRAIR